MKALIWHGPWQMELEEVPEPVPGPGEVLVAVKAVGICGSDVHGYTGRTGRRWPGMIMGHEFAGQVVDVGSGVTRARPGDPVVVSPMFSVAPGPERGPLNQSPHRRLLGVEVNGAYAERVVVQEEQLYPKPPELRWHWAALCEPLAVALHAVQRAPMPLMGAVAVIGAGPIGLLTLLAARLRGAGPIFVTDRNPRRLALARELGAHRTVHVDQEDPVEIIRAATDGGVDVALEAVGIGATAQQAIDVVRNGGQVTWIGNSARTIQVDMQSVVTREITVRGSYAFTPEEFGAAVQALAGERVPVASLIEKVAPLEDGPTIFRQLAEGEQDWIKVILEP